MVKHLFTFCFNCSAPIVYFSTFHNSCLRFVVVYFLFVFCFLHYLERSELICNIHILVTWCHVFGSV